MSTSDVFARVLGTVFLLFLFQNEPDFQTMYHLVCDAQIRPQLPQVQCGSWTNLLIPNRSNSSWTSIEPTLNYGHCMETGEMGILVACFHSTFSKYSHSQDRFTHIINQCAKITVLLFTVLERTLKKAPIHMA